MTEEGAKSWISLTWYFTSSAAAASAGFWGFLNIPPNFRPFSWNRQKSQFSLFKLSRAIQDKLMNNEETRTHLGAFVTQSFSAAWEIIVWWLFLLRKDQNSRRMWPLTSPHWLFTHLLHLFQGDVTLNVEDSQWKNLQMNSWLVVVLHYGSFMHLILTRMKN